MSVLGLLLRNLLYHWRGNLAVLLGTAVGTAVLTGALLVGDSLRGSLKALTLEQLGWVDQALVAGRFFRDKLADALPAREACPAIFLQGSASGARDGNRARAVVLGVDDRFWRTDLRQDDTAFWRHDAEEVVLNASLAEALHVTRPGERVTLHVAKAGN